MGQRLWEKIESKTDAGITIEKLNYEIDNRTIPVIQFLRNVTTVDNKTETQVAVTQILFDYGKILKATRENLIQTGAIIFISTLIFIWLMYLPITKNHKKLINAFDQIGHKKFDHFLSSSNHGEIDIVFNGYNRMIVQLQGFFQEKQKSKIDSAFDSLEKPSSGSKEFSLRKTEITCLCARIPQIQDIIESNTPDSVSSSLTDFLEPLEKMVHEYGGQVVKILGDKVYTLFEGINSVDNSIRTSLKINQKWQIINHENKVLGRPERNYGIGLHSAEGIAGILGQLSMSYSFIGKSASLAEYLCSCAKKEEILISSSMMDKTSGAYQHQLITDLKPSDLAEMEEFLTITNLQTSNDAIFSKTGKAEVKPDIDNIYTEKDEQLLTPTLAGTPSKNSGISGMGNSSFESSIPDMLEETLTSTPLESIKITSPEKTEEEQGDEGGTNLENKAEGNQSLWDKFDSGN